MVIFCQSGMYLEWLWNGHDTIDTLFIFYNLPEYLFCHFSTVCECWRSSKITFCLPIAATAMALHYICYYFACISLKLAPTTNHHVKYKQIYSNWSSGEVGDRVRSRKMRENERERELLRKETQSRTTGKVGCIVFPSQGFLHLFRVHWHLNIVHCQIRDRGREREKRVW